MQKKKPKPRETPRFDRLLAEKKFGEARNAVTRILHKETRRKCYEKLFETLIAAGRVWEAKEVAPFGGVEFCDGTLGHGGHQAMIHGDIQAAVEVRRLRGIPLERRFLDEALEWEHRARQGKGEMGKFAQAVYRCRRIWDDLSYDLSDQRADTMQSIAHLRETAQLVLLLGDAGRVAAKPAAARSSLEQFLLDAVEAMTLPFRDLK